jgi:hypothetical protein
MGIYFVHVRNSKSSMEVITLDRKEAVIRKTSLKDVTKLA